MTRPGSAVTRDTFPLRFKNPRNREALRRLAELTGQPMTDIAERAIEHEVTLMSVDLEHRLEEALALVRDYSVSADAPRYIEAAVAGEAAGLDPLSRVTAKHSEAAPAMAARPKGRPGADPYGVLAAFSRG